MKATKLQRLLDRNLPYSEFSTRVPIGTTVDLPSGERLVFTDRSTLNWSMVVHPKLSSGEDDVTLGINIHNLYNTLHFLLRPSRDNIPAFVEECVLADKAKYGDRQYIVSDKKPSSEDLVDYPKVDPKLLTNPGTAFINWEGTYMECDLDEAGAPVYMVDNHVAFGTHPQDPDKTAELIRAFFRGGMDAMGELTNAPETPTDQMQNPVDTQIPAIATDKSERIYQIRGHDYKLWGSGTTGYYLTPAVGHDTTLVLRRIGLITKESRIEYVNQVLGTPGKTRFGSFPEVDTREEIETIVHDLQKPKTFTLKDLRTDVVELRYGDTVTFSMGGVEYSYHITQDNIYWTNHKGGKIQSTVAAMRVIFGDAKTGFAALRQKCYPITNIVNPTTNVLRANNLSDAKVVLREMLSLIEEHEADPKNLPKTIHSANELADLDRDLVVGDKVIFDGLVTTVVATNEKDYSYGLEHNGSIQHISIHCGATVEEHNALSDTWNPNLSGYTDYVHWLYEKLADKKVKEAQEKELAEIRKSFTSSFNQVASLAHTTAREKGFWDNERNDGEMIALMHSELSEALEAHRKGANDDKLTDRSGVEVELADCLIRILDYGQGRGLDLPGAMFDKMAYNKTREKLHGKKF